MNLQNNFHLQLTENKEVIDFLLFEPREIQNGQAVLKE